MTNNEEGEESEEEQSGTSGDTREGRNGSLSRAGRNVNKPSWMKDYVCEGLSMIIEQEEDEFMALFLADEDTETFEDAVVHERWRKAMEAEIQAINDNNTWELVDVPAGVKVIGVKWFTKTKFNEKGEVDKFKARLVAKGFHQTHGVDFHEVFAPVAWWDTTD